MDFEKEIALLYPWIVKVARKYCWSIQDAEDLANDTVYKALLNKDKFQTIETLVRSDYAKHLYNQL